MNNTFKIVWGAVISILYICIAALLIWLPYFNNRLPHAFRLVMAVLFFLYGAFRAYRIWKLRS